MKTLSVQAYHKLRNEIWNDLVACGVSTGDDENFKAFDDVLGEKLPVNWEWDKSKELQTKLGKSK